MSRTKKTEEPQVSPELLALEAAATLLVDSLPNETMKSVLKETAANNFVPLWIYIAGLLQRAYDTGEHTAPVLDPIWLRSNPAIIGNSGEGTCPICKETFQRRWPGQETCSVICGNTANAARVASEREAHHPQRQTYLVGEEPVGAPRSSVYQAESDGRSLAADAVGEQANQLGDIFRGPGSGDDVAEIEAAAIQALGPLG
jgi:hypothetical protein